MNMSVLLAQIMHSLHHWHTRLLRLWICFIDLSEGGQTASIWQRTTLVTRISFYISSSWAVGEMKQYRSDRERTLFRKWCWFPIWLMACLALSLHTAYSMSSSFGALLVFFFFIFTLPWIAGSAYVEPTIKTSGSPLSVFLRFVRSFRDYSDRWIASIGFLLALFSGRVKLDVNGSPYYCLAILTPGALTTSKLTDMDKLAAFSVAIILAVAPGCISWIKRFRAARYGWVGRLREQRWPGRWVFPILRIVQL